jgi:hypothetical protein
MLPYTETELEWLQRLPAAGRHQETPRITPEFIEQHTAEAHRLRAQAFARMLRTLARVVTRRGHAAATEQAPSSRRKAGTATPTPTLNH